MQLEVVAIGGYEEVGRNMTAVNVDGEIIIFDIGLRLDRVMIHEDTDVSKMHSLNLIEMGIIPDDTVMKNIEGEVKAIVLSHGHLDHIGAITKLAHRYNAPIIGTPYTLELVKREILSERKFDIRNPLITLNAKDTMDLTSNLSLEFVKATHSIPDAVLPVLHTPYGAVLYGNDFKFDNIPIVGERPDYRALKRVGKKGVLCMISESTRVDFEGKTPSEGHAANLLKNDLLWTDNEKNGVVITTFSSHIARIKSITDIAERMGRTPVLIGRSMSKYCGIAEDIGIVKFPENTRMAGDPTSVERTLNQVMKDGKEKYLLVVTGHQGEEGAVLSRMATNKLPFRFEKYDQVVFSADVIPNPMNAAQRYLLEARLGLMGVRLFKGAHVSGHAAKEDHRDMLRWLNPEHIIPAHGDFNLTSKYAKLAEEEGYRLGEDVHLLRNGQSLNFERIM
ncbi:RNase J family beta-CASP ribonuclease [Methanococcus aeolicus]|uniref:Ribonuclease J n=1 Tax=Methanococcus aeolicus (strain ATCC BAA-1280 / DSM 17508 / OCM 812 / Nankai-3) TaxID=419665 RepID=A6UW90_META3|nr:RNase J family beta-CASP ribonuclease [Methanococcus aeolicus]ABR56762.1 beta-lactamase domain protein [Methanococcus aeolicus Nankai-3]UXM84762.1 RNase J family beta-CASP ribonuclease [Methanococcus aeolicus]